MKKKKKLEDFETSIVDILLKLEKKRPGIKVKKISKKKSPFKKRIVIQ